VFGASYPDVLMFILPPGAFIALGFILAGVNLINRGLERRKALRAQQQQAEQAVEAAATVEAN